MRNVPMRRTGSLPLLALAMAACNDAAGPIPERALSARVGAAGKPASITSCGTVIDAPGKYRLDNDLTGCTGVGISIVSSDVTLLLDGHSITGTGPRLSAASMWARVSWAASLTSASKVPAR